MLINLFLTIFTLFTSHLLSANTDIYQINEVAISEARWSQPTDGSDPEIIAWKLKIKIDDGHEFVTSNQELTTAVNPKKIFRQGDLVQILKESNFYDNPNKSWFRINNLTSSIEMDFSGISRTPQPDIGSKNVFLVEAPLLKKSENGWLLGFYINNIHTTFSVDTDKYHDYYQGLPLLLIGKPFHEFDDLGRHRIKQCYFHPIRQKDIELTSEWMGGTWELMVEKHNTTDKLWSINPIGSSELLSWTTRITLEDGQEYTFFGNERFGVFTRSLGYREERDPKVDGYLFRNGDCIVFIKEYPAPNENMQKEYRTKFRILNTRTQTEYDIEGPIRQMNRIASE